MEKIEKNFETLNDFARFSSFLSVYQISLNAVSYPGIVADYFQMIKY